MKAHIPENPSKNVQEVLNSNQLIESIFEGLGEGEDAGIKAVFSALSLPEKEFAFCKRTNFKRMREKC